jgi:hypothetical protein
MGIPLGTGPFAGPPNSPYDCTQWPTAFGVLPLRSPDGSGPASSCIWSDVPANLSYVLAPASGGSATVTQVRVSVGSVTGAMEAVVMRNFFRNTATPGKEEDACCDFVTASAPFTPRANGITSVTVSLPLHEQPPPSPGDTTTWSSGDGLALAVLEPGVPVPLYYLGDATANFLWDTAAPDTRVAPLFSGDTGGFYVAMDADYTPGADATLGHALTGSSGGRPPVHGAQRAVLLIGLPPELSLAGGCLNAKLCIGGPWWVV